MKKRLAAAASLLLFFTQIASADLRSLGVPATKGWQHARTGLILTAHVSGLERRKLGDFGADEADVVAEYDDGETFATIYLFHPGLDSVSVWFDRSQAAILATKSYGSPVGTPASRAFAVQPGAAEDSLRITYPMQGGTLTASALAIVPVGAWLLAVRLSSHVMDPGALDQKMSALLQDIRWPAARPVSPAAAPIVACAKPLHFHNAEMMRPDMTQMLLNSIAPKAAADEAAKHKQPPVTFCRDVSGPDGLWTVYRANEATDSYMLVLGDAGRAIGVGRALVLSGAPAYAVNFYDLTEIKSYPNVTALLKPEQAIALTNGTAPLTSTSTFDGKTDITINAAAVPKK